MKKTLKFIAMLLCAVSFVWMSSCTKDNDNLIVGSWNYDKSLLFNGNYYINPEQLPTLTFNSNGTWTSWGITGTWSIDGDKLTISIFGDTETITIESLTSSELILVYEFKGDMDDTYKEYYSRI